MSRNSGRGRRILFLLVAAAGALAGGCTSTAGVDPRAGAKPRCRWEPAHASNYEEAAGGTRDIDMIVIHDIEGNVASAVKTFQQPGAEKSAHYVVDYGGTITQMVADRDIAWHAGNREMNRRSIGIEHAGFADRNQWTAEEYQASAALVRWLCAAYGIAKDRRHIIGHDEVPDPDDPGLRGGRNHHGDPGRYFDWGRFMALVRKSDDLERRAR